MKASHEAAREEREQREAEFVARQAEWAESAAAQEERRREAFAKQMTESAAKHDSALEARRTELEKLFAKLTQPQKLPINLINQ